MKKKKTYLQLRQEKKIREIMISPYKKWLEELIKLSKLTNNKIHLDTIKVTGNIIIENLINITDPNFNNIVQYQNNE